MATYAIDHLDREGITKALAEARRVLKPEGTFLLMVINADGWMVFVNLLVGLHGGLRVLHGGGPPVEDAWVSRVANAGFEVIERGRAPATVCFLTRKPSEHPRAAASSCVPPGPRP